MKSWRRRRAEPVVNARFRTRRNPSGVDFYASFLVDRLTCDEVRPGRFWNLPGLSEIWEQVVLPLRSIGRPLISPCNSGPFLKRRQMLIVHDVAPIVGPEWFSALYRKKAIFMTRVVLRRVDVAATVSRSSATELQHETGRSDIWVLPNIPRRRLPTGPPSAAIANAIEQPFVLSVSNLEPRKNLSSLFDAWRIVERSHPSALLVVAGAGGARAFGPADLGVASPAIRLLGRIDDSDMAHLFDECVAVATVPLYEGFGRVVVEGLLHGAPVIASDIEAHREVADSGVAFVDPNDVDAIAEAMVGALSDGRVDVTGPVIRYSDADFDRALSEALNGLYRRSDPGPMQNE